MMTEMNLLPDERLDAVNENLRLIQKKNGLTFGTDAYLLAAFAPYLGNCRAVDLGSGTGILSLLLLAQGKVSKVTAVELQPSFAELIGRNAILNGMQEKIRVVEGDIRTLSTQDVGEDCRLVISNPPYMKLGSGRRNPVAEKEIARHECNGTVKDFCQTASRLLGTGGKFLCVWRPERLTELIVSMRENRLEPKRMLLVAADQETEPSLVLTEAIKDAAEGLKMLPPLLLYNPRKEGEKSRTLTPKAQEIYNTGVIGGKELHLRKMKERKEP